MILMTRNPSIDVTNVLRKVVSRVAQASLLKTVIGFGKQVMALFWLFLVVDKQSVETIFDMG